MVRASSSTIDGHIAAPHTLHSYLQDRHASAEARLATGNRSSPTSSSVPTSAPQTRLIIFHSDDDDDAPYDQLSAKLIATARTCKPARSIVCLRASCLHVERRALPVALAAGERRPQPRARPSKIAEAAKRLFARDNLVAWCIVPFDSKKRGARRARGHARAARVQALRLRLARRAHPHASTPRWMRSSGTASRSTPSGSRPAS